LLLVYCSSHWMCIDFFCVYKIFFMPCVIQLFLSFIVLYWTGKLAGKIFKKVHRNELNICLGSVPIYSDSQISLCSRVWKFIIVLMSVNVVLCFKGNLFIVAYIYIYIYTSRGTRRCPGWPMAKSDSNFVYYITKKGGHNKLWKCIGVKYAPRYVQKGPQLTQKAHTCKKKKAVSWMNTMSCSTINRKAKTCNEIGMLPSVWNVTEVFCFPFRSRNINVCRVSDSRACNI